MREENVAEKAKLASGLHHCRGMTEREAASYLSLSPSHFRRLVEQGKMPRPRLVGQRRIFDAEELDQTFFGFPREGGIEPSFGEEIDTWADFK